MILEVAIGVVFGLVAFKILSKGYRKLQWLLAKKQADNILSMISNRPEVQEAMKKYGKK